MLTMDMQELILERLTRMEEKQDRTLEQTTRTNGRVSRLEDDRDLLFKKTSRLDAIANETRGRDKVIWIVLCCLGVMSGYIINSLLK